MVTFENILIEGFGSIVKPLNFELNLGCNLTIIRGKVGAGKTSVPSALCWAIYGKTLKDKSSVETWDEIRGDDYKGTKVEVNFKNANGDTYTVIRCKNYKLKLNFGDGVKIKGGNHLFFLFNGKMVQETKGKVSTQDSIEKALGYSYELFKNSVVFGQKMKRIIEETGPNKKKVFEEAFEVGFIEEAKQLTNLDKDKLTKAYNDLSNNLDIIETKINSLEALLEDTLENESTFNKRKEEEIADLEEQIKENDEELKDIKSKVKKYTLDKSLESKVKLLKEEISNAKDYNDQIVEDQSDLARLESEIKSQNKILSKKPEICPSCNQPLSDKGYESMKELVNNNIEKIQAKVNKLKKSLKDRNFIKISDLEKGLEKHNTQLILQKNSLKEATQAKEKFEKLSTKSEKLKDKLDKVKNSTIKIKSPLYKKRLKVLNSKYKKEKKNLDKLSKEISVKEWLINDPLSNNGLKVYMFDNLLREVNVRLDEYSKILGFRVEFGIDLDSHRKDFYQAILKDDIVIPYEDLSGGQRQLVDTSVAFAIHDVISDIRPINIMFMDEPFESLGVDEIEVVAELVAEKAKDKSLFLITHHQSFSPINVNEIRVYLDENNHTYIE